MFFLSGIVGTFRAEQSKDHGRWSANVALGAVRICAVPLELRVRLFIWYLSNGLLYIRLGIF